MLTLIDKLERGVMRLALFVLYAGHFCSMLCFFLGWNVRHYCSNTIFMFDLYDRHYYSALFSLLDWYNWYYFNMIFSVNTIHKINVAHLFFTKIEWYVTIVAGWVLRLTSPPNKVPLYALVDHLSLSGFSFLWHIE